MMLMRFLVLIAFSQLRPSSFGAARTARKSRHERSYAELYSIVRSYVYLVAHSNLEAIRFPLGNVIMTDGERLIAGAHGSMLVGWIVALLNDAGRDDFFSRFSPLQLNRSQSIAQHLIARRMTPGPAALASAI